MERPRRPDRLRRKLLLATSVFLGLFALVYAAWVVQRSFELYEYVKRRERGWSGAVHVADPVLGYAPSPNARGAHVFPVGPDVPMRFDERGFRIPVETSDPPAMPGPRVLALGCSFTYGDACLAEDTFVERVAAGLGGTALNAGVCGHGYAQMLLRARRLLPKLEPDFVLFQSSPWLWDRAVSGFAESYYGKIPVPFLVATDRGVGIHPPLFESRAVGLPVWEYRDGPPGAREFLSFLGRCGLPLFLHDDRHMLQLGLGGLLGGEAPLAERGPALDHVYLEVARLCRSSRARLVVVLIGDLQGPTDLARLEDLPGAVLVDGTHALTDRLSEQTRAAYLRAYAHWRGDPPRLVDTHFNARAHALVAEAILERLRPLVTPADAR